jgi:O-methyltransferase
MSDSDYEVRTQRNQAKYAYTGLSASFEKAYGASREFTMVSKDRQIHLFDAAQYVARAGVEGAIVECGVWRGGSMMMAAYALLDAGDRERDLYLFDTFAGHPKPDEDKDVDIHGRHLVEEYHKRRTDDGFSDWARVSLEEVRANMGMTGYPGERMHFIKGKVEDTIPAQAPEKIAIIRLDTDWYESTKHTLVHLYPRLSRGGVLVIDDYGHMKGAKAAADEYFDEKGMSVLLTRIDYSCRAMVKV